ncbi:hypothetical protein [Stomatohabitans albus]|uniref:hypothetical protein n=1 Tax=Stomatohabitans albus TaxID=3110766 RepID=UPI00300CCDB7
MRNRMPIIASLVAMVALSGCSLLGQGGKTTPSESASASADATAVASVTPEATPTPEGPQTVAEYDLFLQERANVVAGELTNISNGVTQFNNGAIDEEQLRSVSEEAFRTITEQTTIVKETNVPEGAEDRQAKWLNAASAIQNAQTTVTNCLTASDPVCRAIGNTLGPLGEALNVN